tara:strand:+ start:468 stop:680 length:213 start_codon:yes stop_codon:yes gene_type:complete
VFNHCGSAMILLSILRKHGKLHTFDAHNVYGVYNLPIAYSKLRSMGHKVKKRTIRVDGKKTTEYFMRQHG